MVYNYERNMYTVKTVTKFIKSCSLEIKYKNSYAIDYVLKCKVSVYNIDVFWV